MINSIMEKLIATISANLSALLDQPPVGLSVIDLGILYQHLLMIITNLKTGQNRDIIFATRALIESLANLDQDNLVYNSENLTKAIANATSN